MEKRDFVKFLGINALGLSISPTLISPAQEKRKTGMTVKDLHGYLRSLYKIEGESVDQIIIGDPDATITRIGTCWMPYWSTLKKAAEAGVNTLVVHEPTFYTHFDLKHIEADFKNFPEPAKRLYLDQAARKKEWIDQHKIAIIRCHDVWDIIPKTGIPFAFGKALGYKDEDIIRSEAYYNVYRIEETTAKNAAQQIAAKLAVFGQKGVAFYGDENRIVRSVGVGTGAICNPVRFMRLDADLRIAIDDSVTTWTQTYFAEDTGNPLVIINHGTSEENGMKMLNSHLKEHFKDIEVIHFDQGCGYRWIS